MKVTTCLNHFIRAGWRILGVCLLVLVLGTNFSSAQPEIRQQPIDQIGVELDSDTGFFVEAVGTDKLEYQWQLNGVNIPGATEASLPILKLRLEHAGTYSVVVADSKGAVNSAPALLVPAIPFFEGMDGFQERFLIGPRNELNPGAGFFRTSNKGATREAGEPLHAGMKGGNSIWFSWTAPENGIARFSARGSGFDTLLGAYLGESIDKLQRFSKTAQDDDGGGFSTSAIAFNAVKGMEYLIAVDGFEGASGHVVLQWNMEVTQELLPIIIDVPTNRTVEADEQVILNVDFEGKDALWFHNGQPTQNTGKTLVIDKADERWVGRYSVAISDGERREVKTVPADIQINISDDKLDAATFAHDKFMAASDGNRDGDNPKQQQTYRIGKSSGPARGYTTTQVFSTVGATKDPGEPNHAGVIGGASEWYTYVAPANGTLHINTDGSSYDTVLAVYTGPGFDFATLSVVASNNKSGVNGGDSVRFSASLGTVYYIAVDGVGGASGTVKLNINLGNPPSITSQPQARTVGVGTNATFTVTASGTTPIRYQWRFNGVNIANATNASYTRISARTNHAGNYRVVVSNPINVVTSSVASLTVVLPPTITAEPVSQTVDVGANVNFSVGATGGEPLHYQWMSGDFQVAGATNSTLSLTNVQAGDAGEYSVVITNIAGSATSATATLSINSAAPAISSHPASRTVAPAEDVVLSVTASGSPAPSYQWFFNGAPIGASSALLPLWNFQAANEGNYHVVVSNALGVATSEVALLKLSSPPRTASFGLSTNGSFSLNFIGVAGTNYVLEASTNLMHWSPLVTNSSPSGFLDFTDPAAGDHEGRFYRIVGQ